MNENPLENKEKKSIMYTAEFVQDIQSLLNKFPPKHNKILGHHSTIAFKPRDLSGIEIGKVSLLKVIGRAYDEKGDALLVENIKSNNEHPHITLSCAEGVPAVYSNELIKKAIVAGTIEYLSSPEYINVTEGYSDGKVDILEKEEEKEFSKKI